MGSCIYDDGSVDFYYRGYGGSQLRWLPELEALQLECELTPRPFINDFIPCIKDCKPGGTFWLHDPTLCTVDAECDDGVACNGVETCLVQEIATTVYTKARCVGEDIPCDTAADQ